MACSTWATRWCRANGATCCLPGTPSKQPLPLRKFNGAQQTAYTSVVLMGLGSLPMRLAIYKPTQLGWLTTLLGGYETARALHFALTIGYVNARVAKPILPKWEVG